MQDYCAHLIFVTGQERTRRAQSNSELADELKEFVKSHLAVYKYPRWIEFIDAMPKNDRGKIDRKQLKARDQ